MQYLLNDDDFLGVNCLRLLFTVFFYEQHQRAHDTFCVADSMFNPCLGIIVCGYDTSTTYDLVRAL